jgi:exopolysaccharide biosynthesis polyprenyl glycosylphosphotransferase
MKAMEDMLRNQERLVRLSSLVTFGYSLLSAVLASAIGSLLHDVRAEMLLASAVGTICLAALRGAYRTRMVPDTTSMVAGLAQAATLSSALVLLVSNIAGFRTVDPVEFFLMIGGSCIAAVAGMFLGSQSLKWLWKRGIGRSRAVVVGTGRLTDELILELRHRPTYGVDIVAVVHVGTPPESVLSVNPDVPQVTLEQLPETVNSVRADRVMIGPSTGDEKNLVAVARWAAARGLPVFVVPRLFEMGVGLDSLTPDRVRGYPLVRVQRSAHPRIGLRMKRVLDVAVSATAIVILGPVMAVCAIAVKLTSRGPVLFSQERVGKGGRLIMVSKFRSMTTSDKSDVEWTSEQRITPVGSFLRRTTLDELPQLFSILRGDMSLVGPRPERPAFVKEFSAIYADYDDRHRMPVGLTGLAQVVGLVGDTSIEERIKYDNLYIDQWSFGGDLQIIVKTVWSILRQPHHKREQKDLESILGTPEIPVTTLDEEAV